MGDFNGSNYKDKFIGELVDYVASDKFQNMFEEYFLSHALEFSYEEEHKIKYYEMYKEFHSIFEKQLEEFCLKLGISQAQFLKSCRGAIIDDPKAKHYVNILLSSVEYETFVKLMKLMRPIAQHKLLAKAEAKEASKTNLKNPTSPNKSETGALSPSKMTAKGLDFDNVSNELVDSKALAAEEKTTHHDEKTVPSAEVKHEVVEKKPVNALLSEEKGIPTNDQHEPKASAK